METEIPEFKYIKTLLEKLIRQHYNEHRKVIIDLIEEELDRFSCLNNCPNCGGKKEE